MRLSDIRGERVFDVIADIIEPVASIVTSEEFKELRDKQECPEGMDPRDFMASRIRNALPKLIKEHKGDVVEILATLDGLPYEEYANSLTLPKLISDATDLFTDEVALDFLASVARKTE